MKNTKLKGFTLAEVLITLSILGVVAAILIPNIIGHYKKNYTETRLKQAYSIISRCVDMSEAFNGPAELWDEWANGDTVVFAERYILPYLDYTLLYSDNNTGSPKGKYPYTGIQNGRYAIKDLKGTSSWDGVGLKSGTVWIRLKNGMDVGIKRGIHGWINAGLAFWIDIDGANKGKNQVGNDIFVISLKVRACATNLRDCMPTVKKYRAFVEPGLTHPTIVVTQPNHFTSNQILGTTIGYCNKDAASDNRLPSGAWCSYIIYKNGWKIPKDYPIKF